MAEWPTPTDIGGIDTGIGLHGCADCHWKPSDFADMVRQFKERGVFWKLLFVCDESKQDWARFLVVNGIMPVLRIYPMFAPGLKFDIAHMLAYRDAGVKWFVLGNEPNLGNEWVDVMPKAKEAAYKVAEAYAAKAGVVRDNGMWPLTPPLALGGNINHRVFFEHFMDRIGQLGNPVDILYPGGIGIHCRSVGNPLDKGPSDYDCSAREWEWFDDVVKAYCGRSLPMMNTEAFDEPDWLPRLPNGDFDWQYWESRNREQFQWFNPKYEGYRYPDYVLCNTFWLAKSTGFLHPWDEDGMWDNHQYSRQTGQGFVTNLWKNLPGFVTWTREDDPTPPPPPPPPPPVQLRVYDEHGTKQSLEWAQQVYGVGYEAFDGEGWHCSIMRELCGPAGIDVWLYNDDGSAAQGVPVTFWWPGGSETKHSEVTGKAGFAYGPGSYITDPNVGGPHWITIGDGTAYDRVDRLGMLAGTFHCHLNLTYKWGKLEEPTPPDPSKEIMAIAEEMLGAMPVPIDWALPSAAAKDGYTKQVGGYFDYTHDDGTVYNCQTFSTPEGDNYPHTESLYRVYYCVKHVWDKVWYEQIVRD